VLCIGAIAEYPSTFEDLTCYHDKMIRSENDYVIIVYSRFYKACVSYILRYCARVMITSEVFRSGRVYSAIAPLF
jgi:hypothetical protein